MTDGYDTDHVRRMRAVRPKLLMWALAILYPLGTILTVIVKTQQDPLSIFDRYYLLFTVLILPPALIAVAIWIGAQRHSPSWGWTLVLVIWTAAVAYLHYTYIGLAGARG